MEKKMILVGMSGRATAFQFMNAVMDSLHHRSVDIVHIDHHNIRFETFNTKVWFVSESGARSCLNGILADAVFGEAWPAVIYRAKHDAVIASRDHIGLVEYICQVEREAYRNTTDMCVCDMYPPSLFITMPPRNGKSFYRQFMNSVYGEFPEGRPPFVALDTDTAPKVEFIRGRGNGKSQACIEYMKKLIERGEISMDAANAYIRNDIHMTRGVAMLAATMRELDDRIKRRGKLPGIKNVHFSGPVTAVIWEDGTKTIVRCQGDNVQDPEKGLAMAIAKKALGTNKSGSNYYDIFKQWLPKEEEPVVKYEEDNGVVLTPMEEKYDG